MDANLGLIKSVALGSVIKEPKKESFRGSVDRPLILYVLDKEAGRVIGRGGEVIREIMDRSGADVKVEKSEAAGESYFTTLQEKLAGEEEKHVPE